jgi:acyl carrier protein
VVSDRLKAVILRELELDDWSIDDHTTAGMVPGWDSLSHVRVITAIESEYGLRFKTREIVRVKNVGELQTLVDSKTGA